MDLHMLQPKEYVEHDLQSLSKQHKRLMVKLWQSTAVCIASIAVGIAIGWFTKSTSLMMNFVCIGVLSMFKWIEVMQRKVETHCKCIRVASNSGKLPYHEVLVNLDVLGASIKLTRRAYKSYCRHWNSAYGV